MSITNMDALINERKQLHDQANDLMRAHMKIALLQKEVEKLQELFCDVYGLHSMVDSIIDSSGIVRESTRETR